MEMESGKGVRLRLRVQTGAASQVSGKKAVRFSIPPSVSRLMATGQAAGRWSANLLIAQLPMSTFAGGEHWGIKYFLVLSLSGPNSKIATCG